VRTEQLTASGVDDQLNVTARVAGRHSARHNVERMRLLLRGPPPWPVPPSGRHLLPAGR
jgi:hypothetical protein